MYASISEDELASKSKPTYFGGGRQRSDQPNRYCTVAWTDQFLLGLALLPPLSTLTRIRQRGAVSMSNYNDNDNNNKIKRCEPITTWICPSFHRIAFLFITLPLVHLASPTPQSHGNPLTST